MDDLVNARLFFQLFALALVIYGGLMVRTGAKALVPARAAHSIRGPEDVRRVGWIVMIVGLAIIAVAQLTRLLP